MNTLTIVIDMSEDKKVYLAHLKGSSYTLEGASPDEALGHLIRHMFLSGDKIIHICDIERNY